MNRTSFAGVFFSLVFSLIPSLTQAITIDPIFVDGNGETWNPTRKGVILQAINDWQGLIPDDHRISVTFDFTRTGVRSYLGMWSGRISSTYGADLSPWSSGVTHTIHFNADRFSGSYYTWWDSTPSTVADMPYTTWDALSIARHEIGHLLGFTESFYFEQFATFQQVDKWTAPMTGTIFDQGGLNVAMESADDLSHVANSGSTTGDLMTTAILNGIRRGISTLDVNMLRLAYGYQAPISSWKGNNGANYLITSNWANGYVPNGIDTTATFSNTLVVPATVSVNGNVTVGNLVFDSNQSYSLIGSGSLTLQTTGNDATIQVESGEHHLDVPLVLQSDTILSGPGTLDMIGGISGDRKLTVLNTTLNVTSIQVDSLTIGSSSATTVPEPSTVVLLALAGLFGGVYLIERCMANDLRPIYGRPKNHANNA